MTSLHWWLHVVGGDLYVFLWHPAVRWSGGSIPVYVRQCSALSVKDVWLKNTTDPMYVQVLIKSLKTDRFRHGAFIYFGRCDSNLCPVGTVVSYMVLRGSAPGPFFKFADGQYLTRDWFMSNVHSALQRAGNAHSRYSGHRFQIGVETTAALCGLPDSLIKTLGGWESPAYTVYIRTLRETSCIVARSLISGSGTWVLRDVCLLSDVNRHSVCITYVWL